MSKQELVEWLNSIHSTLGILDIKSTPNNVKNLSAIYYEIERVANEFAMEVGEQDG